MVENPKRGIVDQTVTWTIKTCDHYELVLWSTDMKYRCKYCGAVAEVKFVDEGNAYH